MSKFAKIIINRNTNEFRNIHYLPFIIDLYEKYSRYLHDDYFLDENTTSVDAVIKLIEKTSPFFWVVIDNNEKFTGFVFLDNLVGKGRILHSAEVTTCFEPLFWGKYTKDCAQKFVKYCFKKYSLKKLKALIFPQNQKVRCLLKKAGFQKEAFLKTETIKNGEWQDIELYSIIRKDEK